MQNEAWRVDSILSLPGTVTYRSFVTGDKLGVGLMRAVFCAILVLLGLAVANPVHANALSDSWQCAKKAGLSSVSIGKDLYKKGEALAEKAGPLSVCLAKTGPEGQALMVTSSALTALRLAKPALLPMNKCEPTIRGLATKPFATGLAALLPSGGARTKLISAVNSEVASDEIWNQIDQLPPPFSSVSNQISCGCLISDGALTLTDISEITNAISETSQSCGAMLDSIGLGFINDIGSYAGKLTKSLAYGVSGQWDQLVSGQGEPAPPGAVFQSYFGDHMDFFATVIAINTLKDTPANWVNEQEYHDVKSCQYVGPSYCLKNVNQLTQMCIDYYDEHRMSKSNATKACNSYRNTAVAAANAKAQTYVALSKIPSLMDVAMLPWVKSEWLWRLPKTYQPGTYNYESGSVGDWTKSDPTGFALRNMWGDVLGNAGVKTNKNGSNYLKWDFEPTGIYATARVLMPELGNDPEKAAALSYASAVSPLQDKTRKIWNDSRKGVGLFQLRSWYPKPTWGFRYGCPGNLENACASAIEAKFDKLCFTPFSELYVTGPSINDTQVFVFVKRYDKAKAACQAATTPVLASAAKLDLGEATATNGLCPTIGTRDEQAACNAGMQTAYRDCAGAALKKGKEDVTQCMQGKSLGKSILEQIQKGMQTPGKAKPPVRQPSPPPAETPSRKP
jgi:hypothetical protein